MPQQMTKIQLQERANRRWRGYRARFGIPTPPGTKPNTHRPTGEMVYKPLNLPAAPFLLDISTLIRRINSHILRPWWDRRSRHE